MVRRIMACVIGMVLLAAALAGGWAGYQYWAARAAPSHDHDDEPQVPVVAGTLPVKLTAQARENLNLVAKPLQPATYWRTIELPAEVVDRPGVSDRGVVATVSGVVAEIHTSPGATVEPGDPLYTLRLVSESLHASQLELYKATREIEIARKQRARLEDLAQSGALPQSRMIEINNQIERMQVNADAYRQDLRARGLPADDIDAAAEGQFVTQLVVRAPQAKAQAAGETALTSATGEEPRYEQFGFEVESLAARLGEQVDAGQVLCHLADHRLLLIEGRGFKDDMPIVQEAARNGWTAEADFETTGSSKWPEFTQQFRIESVANTVDSTTRTFAFFLPLENQWQQYTQGDASRILWRFRPGMRLRLRVPVEKLENVFVLPQEAVVREGPEAYVFRQNGDLFDRRPVHIVHEDRQFVVLANDGSVRPGFYIAQNGAASLQRVMKAQAASGAPHVHVHADGSVHGAH